MEHIATEDTPVTACVQSPIIMRTLYLPLITLLCRNGKPGHTSVPPQSLFRQPNTNDIDNLQARIRNMLSDTDSPTEQTTHIGSSRGGGRGLYHSPPLHRTHPPSRSGHRNTRSFSTETPWDNCEDITSYVLGIVKSLEIPEDERREKEEFCEDLDRLVQGLRPSNPRSSIAVTL